MPFPEGDLGNQGRAVLQDALSHAQTAKVVYADYPFNNERAEMALAWANLEAAIQGNYVEAIAAAGRVATEQDVEALLQAGETIIEIFRKNPHMRIFVDDGGLVPADFPIIRDPSDTNTQINSRDVYLAAMESRLHTLRHGRFVAGKTHFDGSTPIDPVNSNPNVALLAGEVIHTYLLLTGLRPPTPTQMGKIISEYRDATATPYPEALAGRGHLPYGRRRASIPVTPPQR